MSPTLKSGAGARGACGMAIPGGGPGRTDGRVATGAAGTGGGGGTEAAERVGAGGAGGVAGAGGGGTAAFAGRLPFDFAGDFADVPARVVEGTARAAVPVRAVRDIEVLELRAKRASGVRYHQGGPGVNRLADRVGEYESIPQVTRGVRTA